MTLQSPILLKADTRLYRKHMLWLGGGGGNPYAGNLVAFDMASPDNYTESGGRVVGLKNLGDGGAAYDAIQANLTDAPLLGTMADGAAAMVFGAGEEWLECDALATLFNLAASAVIEIDIIYELLTLSPQQAFFIASNSASNNGYLWVGHNGAGDIRNIRRDEAGLQQVRDSAPVLSTGVTHITTFRFEYGLLSAFHDGAALFTNVDYVGPSGDLNCNQFSIGCRELIGASLGMEGKIEQFRLRVG